MMPRTARGMPIYAITSATLAIVEARRWTGIWMVGGRRSELMGLLHWIKSVEPLLHWQIYVS